MVKILAAFKLPSNEVINIIEEDGATVVKITPIYLKATDNLPFSSQPRMFINRSNNDVYNTSLVDGKWIVEKRRIEWDTLPEIPWE
jgi:hypothetical protein